MIIFTFIYNNLEKEGIVMTKKRKSKILAAALCTAVMAGIYAAPVMASDLQVIINNELKAYEPAAPGAHIGNVKGSFFIAGSDIANALQGENLTLGQLVTTGDATVNGIFTANGSMQVTGRANIGELYVAGNKLVADSNGVRVNGALTAKDVFIDNLSVKGDKFTVNELGEVTAKGAAELNGGLTVNNGATVNGQLTANDGLLVTDEGVHIEQGGLLVDAGLAELNGGLDVTGGAKADSLEVTADFYRQRNSRW